MLGLAACGAVHTESVQKLSVCGTVLYQGAADHRLVHLVDSMTTQLPTPSRSQLPSARLASGRTTTFGNAFIQLSGCTHGTTVIVTAPPGSATYSVAYAKDGLIAGLGLELTPGTTTVEAWQAGRFLGEIASPSI
jgi:hypothetical protein